VALCGEGADHELAGDLVVAEAAGVRSRMSRSRSVRAASAGSGACGSRRAANSAIRRRVIVGEISASPAAMTSIACSSSRRGVSLRRKPLAPARSAA